MTSSMSNEYESFLNRSIWTKSETLTDTNTLCQSGPESNGNEGVFHTPYISRTGASSLDAVYCHPQDTPNSKFHQQGGLFEGWEFSYTFPYGQITK